VETKTRTDYRRLIDISRDLASTLDLDTLLYRIVKVAAEIANAAEASILLYDDVAGKLRFQVATNMDLPNMRGALLDGLLPIVNLLALGMYKTIIAIFPVFKTRRAIRPNQF